MGIAGDQRNLGRTARSLAVLLVALALPAFGLSGCGRDVSSAPKQPAAAAAQAITTAGTRAVTAAAAPSPATTPTSAATLSLHERVMQEQKQAQALQVALQPARSQTAGQPAPSAQAPEVQFGSPTPSSTPTAEQAPTAAAVGATNVVLTDGQTPLRGEWSGTADRLASFLLATAPSPRFTVPAAELAAYYVRYCNEAGLRADLLWAQMLLETGYGMYSGDVSPAQNNYAGIGATGGGAAGASFATAEAGVMAQVAHMVAYVYPSSPVVWANSTTDPRFDFVTPRGTAVVLSDLNARWAVPGTAYGENIERIVRAINGG